MLGSAVLLVGIHTANLHCEEPCGTPGASERLCEPSSACTSQTIVKGKQKNRYKPQCSPTPVSPTSPSAPLPPAATFPKTNQEGRGPLLKRMKRFPQLDLRQQVRAARSSLSAREASHCSRAGPSGDPGGQLSEGCH